MNSDPIATAVAELSTECQRIYEVVIADWTCAKDEQRLEFGGTVPLTLSGIRKRADVDMANADVWDVLCSLESVTVRQGWTAANGQTLGAESALLLVSSWSHSQENGERIVWVHPPALTLPERMSTIERGMQP